MRIALTLDSDATKREENDYIGSLLAAGFSRDEIEVVEPGSAPPEEFDGVLLGGGCDVDPARYGRERRADARLELDPGRDSTDFALLDRARRQNAPVFGICRGLQVVNVALGGTLVQDIPTELPSSAAHHRRPRQKTRRDHDVAVVAGTRLAKLTKRDVIAVNSRHHQAIESLAPGLAVSATAPDGLIEAVEAPAGPWLVAVQWHPENLSGDPVSTALFSEFARAVRESSSKGISPPAQLLSQARGESAKSPSAVPRSISRVRGVETKTRNERSPR